MCSCLFHSADIISTVEFNQDGEFLATGDKGGRVVVFQRDGTKVLINIMWADLNTITTTLELVVVFCAEVMLLYV